MKGLYRFWMAGVMLASLSSYRCWADRRFDSPTLTSEQVGVYGDLLDSLSRMNFKFLAKQTIPLDVSSLGGDAPCLQGLELERAAESGKAVHSLGREVLRGRSVEFVGEKEVASLLKERDEERAANPSGSKKDSTGTAKDPGILVLSEMVFDKSHQFVVLKYLFLCGSRCNSGAILVLEKVGSHWTGKTRRPCSFVLNQENPLR